MFNTLLVIFIAFLLAGCDPMCEENNDYINADYETVPKCTLKEGLIKIE